MPHHVIPTPYEYALISKAAYYDNAEILEEQQHLLRSYLTRKGWYPDRYIHEGEYYASIWVNPITHQVVIAHRGSQNATSWVTDIESVVEGKPGLFVSAAIDTLNDERVRYYLSQGYRLSTTGHSLGGFLAQVCVYWSQRRDFEFIGFGTDAATSSSSSTPPMLLSASRPEVSAVVFDSPGVVEFLERLHSNLRSEQNTIDLSRLNVHNFCAMPTIVSTYGTQTGTIWHLGGVDVNLSVKLAFFDAHRMDVILQGFNPESGLPRRLRQMTGWPRADYSAYSSLSGILESGLKGAAKVPFSIINGLYKRFIKQSSEPTWYDQVCTSQNEVSVTLASPVATDSEAQLTALEERLRLAIQGHYSPLDADNSRCRLAFYHLDQALQNFLDDLVRAKNWDMATFGWDKALESTYDAATYRLLQALRIEIHGTRVELVVSADYEGTVFEAHNQLLTALQTRGILSLTEFMHDTAKDIHDNAALVKELHQRLEERQQDVTQGRTFILRSGIAEAEGSTVLVFLSSTKAGSDDLKYAMKHAKPGDSYTLDSAVAKAKGSMGVIMPPKLTETARYALSLPMFNSSRAALSSSTSSTTSNQKDHTYGGRADLESARPDRRQRTQKGSKPISMRDETSMDTTASADSQANSSAHVSDDAQDDAGLSYPKF